MQQKVPVLVRWVRRQSLEHRLQDKRASSKRGDGITVLIQHCLKRFLGEQTVLGDPIARFRIVLDAGGVVRNRLLVVHTLRDDQIRLQLRDHEPPRYSANCPGTKRVRWSSGLRGRKVSWVFPGFKAPEL